MKYPACEKLEIIRLVEQSHLPVRRTLAKLGILPATFYRWYDRYRTGGPEALEDRKPRPKQVCNRIADGIRERIVQLALDEPDVSSRELATRFTDGEATSSRRPRSIASSGRMISSPARLLSSSKRPMRSRTRRPDPTSSGRPTSPISRSSAGAGSTCRPSRATSWPGRRVKVGKRTLLCATDLVMPTRVWNRRSEA